MPEILLGAALIAVTCYFLGVWTGTYLSHRRAKYLTKLYKETISSARYVADIVNAKEDRGHYFDDDDA